MRMSLTNKAPDENSAKKLDKVTDDRLKQTGIITVIIHRIKNLHWPSKNTRLNRQNNIPHNVQDFESVPKKAIESLGTLSPWKVIIY